MANTVTFKIKIEGENEIKSVTVDAEQMGRAFEAVQSNVKGLKSELVSLSSIVQLIDGATSAVGQLQGILSSYISAYAAGEAAETRLAQAMRNTMGASDEEIQSIKDLAVAQQQLGIVDAGVQLAAAQELATYLEFSDSLKTIIPVLNDMIAQQLGLGASAESATQIATMLGKVMNGQTEALSRYGYKFDEAQKYILQYGDECDRAAILAEVVSDSVGGMNAAMAQTPSGRLQQTANTINDVKAKIGQAVQVAMPFVSILAEISMAASGILKLATAFKTVAQNQIAAKVQTLALTAARPLLQFYYVMKDDETSTLDRILIYAAIFYIILPMDLIPSVIYKFLGVLDDGVAMLYIHKRIKEKITPEINDMVESTLDEWFEDAYKPGIV